MKKAVVLKIFRNIATKINLFKVRIIVIVAIFFTSYLLSCLNNSDLDKMVTSLGLGLLTLLIPLAMGILLDVYQKRREKENEFIDIDLQVILNRVFKIKWLVWIVLLIFVPMMFWRSFNNIFARFFELMVSSIGLSFIASTIFDTYNWMIGNAFEYRYKYLKLLKSSENMRICWHSVWSADGNELDKELKFFEVFSEKVNNLIRESRKGKNTSVLINILSSFREHIKNRSIYFLIDENVFSKISELHFKELKFSMRNRFSYDHERLLNEINQMITNIEQSVVNEVQFHFLPTNIEKHIREVVDKDPDLDLKEKNKYLKSLFSGIFNTLFTKIEEADDVEEFLKSFPKEWKVTKDNLVDENKEFSVIFLGYFLDWTDHLIKQKKDIAVLGDVLKVLFPDTNGKFLIKAFKFAFVPSFADKRKIECVAECQWYPKIIQTYGGSADENTQNLNTYELIETIAKIDGRLKELTDKEALKKYLDEVKERWYGPLNDFLNNELKKYESFLSGMLKYLEEKDKGESNEQTILR